MPDLWAHFQAGHRGTIDLTVVVGDNAPTDGTFTPGDIRGTGDDEVTATDRAGGVNARTVVINEMMWGRDNSQVGGLGYTREQWIEIYNTKTTPVPFENIRITLSNVHPAPTNASTDRLSTNPSFTNVWDITGKGQDGHPGAADGSGRVEFASMHRTKLDNGWTGGHWGKAGGLFLPNFRGTPGEANALPALPGPRDKPGTDTPAKNKIIINEIANLTGEADWIELRNVTDSPQSLEKWALSMVTEYNNEAEIVRFPKYSIPAGGVLLLVNANPKGTPLARGKNIKVPDADQDFGYDGNISYLIVKGEENHGFTGIAINIPNNNNWMLILRSGQPWNVKDGRSVYNSGHRIEDVAGPALIQVKDLNAASPRKEKKGDGNTGGEIWETTLFPLNGRGESGDKQLRHERDLNTEGKVWARNGGKHGFQVHAFNHAGFTGIGYDRNVKANDAHGGTPGYDNGTSKGKTADLDGGTLVISELMLATDNNRYPQWIELQNTSKTRGISFGHQEDHVHGTDPKHKHPWQITIENHNSGTWASNNRPLHVTINLQDWFKHIPPNQSVLIAAFVGSFSDNLPEERVADVTMTKKDQFKMDGRRDSFLNAEGGFLIRIEDGNGNVVDEVGNLDGIKEDLRAGIGIDSPVGFDWSTAMTEDGERTSLIRIKDGGTRGKYGTVGTPGTARVGVPTRDDTGAATDTKGAVIPLGEGWRGNNTKVGTGEAMEVWSKYADYAWIHAVDSDMVDVPRSRRTWFGTSSDIGTPLHVAGLPLPVSLSFFRPTLEDGKVVIRWTTESELDNAGFNILRSDSRNGEFKQVNDKLIQGKGTTAERSTYKWVDTSAKPGAVYYYQIEDVSFAGERTTLTTTKLKGLISAKNKLTTTWSELKSQN